MIGWILLLALLQIILFFVVSSKIKQLSKRLQGLEWVVHKKEEFKEKEVKKE